MKKETPVSSGARPSRKGVSNANRGDLITKHQYKSTEGLIKAGPIYHKGFVWRSKANSKDGL